jgi:hypothetical protein
MVKNFAKKYYIATELIQEVFEHPEAYGHIMVMLKNGMYTDVYFDEAKKMYYTLTNDVKLIKLILNEANELSLVQKIKNKVLKNKKGERK